MLLRYLPETLFRPREVFVRLRKQNLSLGSVLLGFVLPLALIAPVAAYFGTTIVGWSVGGGEPIRLTTESALKISVAYFIGVIVATLTVARFIQWMSQTYGDQQSFVRCLALAAFAATPLYLAGALQAYPVVWLNYVIGLPILAFSIYLLYLGIEVLFELSRERVLLFGGAILLVGMVALVGLLVATVLLWQSGVGPSFTSGPPKLVLR